MIKRLVYPISCVILILFAVYLLRWPHGDQIQNVADYMYMLRNGSRRLVPAEGQSEPPAELLSLHTVRRRHLHGVCNQSYSSPPPYSHLLVDDSRRLIYCYVPKSGCTSYKHLLAAAAGRVSRQELSEDWELVHFQPGRVGLRTLSQDPQRQWKLANYTRFVVVRSPWARLYSAYYDKFVRNYDRFVPQYYLREFRQLFGDDLKEVGGRFFVSFQQFIKMVIAAKSDPDPTAYNGFGHNDHWDLMTRICEPCIVRYDYISHLETTAEDSGPILKLLNASELPRLNVNKDENIKLANVFGLRELSLEEAYSNISASHIQALNRLYHSDLELFMYEPL